MTWNEMPHWARCIHLMKALRGNWNGGRNNSSLGLLYVELKEAKAEGAADAGWIRAVQANADYFDGRFRDGRIFRDGRRFMPSEIAASYGIQPTDGDPEGQTSVSGNLIASTGQTTVVKEGEWYGNYEELPVPDVTEVPGPDAQCPSTDCLSHS